MFYGQQCFQALCPGELSSDHGALLCLRLSRMDRAVYLENDFYPLLWSELYLVLVDAIKKRI
jgi:hypothetical protein